MTTRVILSKTKFSELVHNCNAFETWACSKILFGFYFPDEAWDEDLEFHDTGKAVDTLYEKFCEQYTDTEKIKSFQIAEKLTDVLKDYDFDKFLSDEIERIINSKYRDRSQPPTIEAGKKLLLRIGRKRIADRTRAGDTYAVLIVQYAYTVEFDFFRLLESYHEIKRNKEPIYQELMKYEVFRKKPVELFWTCWLSKRSNYTRHRIMDDGDYYPIWNECQYLLEKMELNRKIKKLENLDLDKVIQSIRREFKRNENANRKTKSKSTKPVARFSSPEGLKWEEITIEIVSEEALRISAKNDTKTYHYANIGFTDGRVGDKPTSRWAFLKQFAQYQGDLSWKDGIDDKEKSKVKAIIKELRKIFKKIMGLDEDPFFPYHKFKAYRTRFLLRDSRHTTNLNHTNRQRQIR